MSAHTPGPWFAKTATFTSDGDFEIWSKNGFFITKTVGEIYEEEANARLIAAAPELLALLKRYRAETPLGHQPHMLAHEADAAITKATGAAA